jgi:hypothetical protein
MQWMAVSEKDTATDTLEKCLWDAAEPFRLKKFEMRSSMWEVESARHSAFAVPNVRSPRCSSLTCSATTGTRTTPLAGSTWATTDA